MGNKLRPGRESLRPGAGLGGTAGMVPAVGSRDAPSNQTSLLSPRAVEQTLLPATGELSAAEPEVSGEQRWLAVFRCLQDDGEVHRDYLLLAAQMAGFLHPEVEAIDNVLATSGLTRYNTLDRAEFMRFLRSYEAQEQHTFEDAFQRQGPDAEGMIQMQEINAVLNKCNINLLDSVVLEAAREVDRRGTQRFTLAESKRVLEVLCSRDGFSRHDVDRFKRAFAKFGANKCGLVDSQKLPDILGWLGYPALNEHLVAEIASEASVGGGGNLNKYTFLICMRKIHDLELGLIQKLMQKFEVGLDLETEVVEFLRSLGYTPDREATVDAAEAAGIALSGKASKPSGRRKSRRQRSTLECLDSPSLSDLLRLLEIYRVREGLPLTEVKEVEGTFQRYDHEGSSAISTLQVGKVLRWLGLPTSWEVQQQLVTEVDVDQSGQLTLQELKKVMRKHREQEDMRTKLAFEEYDLEATGVMSLQQSKAALSTMGFSMQLSGIEERRNSTSSVGSGGDPDQEDVGDKEIFARLAPRASAKSARGIDVYGFIELAARLRSQARVLFRDNVGYTPEEVENLTKVFAEYDMDGSGDISHEELRLLLQDLFPDLSTSSERRQDLLRLLAEIDADGNGRLDFPDFLRLMRQFHDLEEQDGESKEQNVVGHTKFTREEVEQFRELFDREARRGADGKDRLVFSAFAEMIGGVCPLHERHLNDLYTTFIKIAGNKDHLETPTVEFPGFLMLMRRLLDEDFANLDQNAKRVVEGQQN